MHKFHTIPRLEPGFSEFGTSHDLSIQLDHDGPAVEIELLKQMLY
jgi:hypothetical protein